MNGHQNAVKEITDEVHAELSDALKRALRKIKR
jgi:hypothetical protein